MQGVGLKLSPAIIPKIINIDNKRNNNNNTHDLTAVELANTIIKINKFKTIPLRTNKVYQSINQYK